MEEIKLKVNKYISDNLEREGREGMYLEGGISLMESVSDELKLLAFLIIMCFIIHCFLWRMENFVFVFHQHLSDN